MRWINNYLRAATGTVAGLLLLAVSAAAFDGETTNVVPGTLLQENTGKPPRSNAADATNLATGTLLLRNGDSLDGTLLSIDNGGVVRWKHADVAEPIAFKLNSIAQLDAQPPAQPGRGTNHPCKVFLAQGDALEGSLVSCSADTLTLQTWYAGELKLPRNQVQAISFFPTIPDLFTSVGPEGWTQGATTGVPGLEAGNWIYRDGAYYTDKSASLARDVHLPDSAELQIDLAWSGTLSLSLALYSDSLQPMIIANKDLAPNFGAFYSMRFLTLSVELMRIKKLENPIINLAPVIVPAFSQTNRVRIDVRTDKKANLLALTVDGQLLQVWKDTNGFVGQGTGIRFVHGASGPVKISNLRVDPWDGVLAAGQTNTPAAAKQDVAWLTNSTTVAGTIESLADGKLNLAGPAGRMEIPLEGVTRLAFTAQAAPVKEPPGSVHATFARGGNLTFQLEGWTAEGVKLRSPVLGAATFNPSVFRRMIFPAASGDAGTNGTAGAP